MFICLFGSLTNDRWLIHGNALRFEVLADAGQPLNIGAPAPAQHVDPLHLCNKTHLLAQLALWPPVWWRDHTAHPSCLGLFPHCIQVHQGVQELPWYWPEDGGVTQCCPALWFASLALPFFLQLAFLLSCHLFLTLPLLVTVSRPQCCWFELSGIVGGSKHRGGGGGGHRGLLGV